MAKCTNCGRIESCDTCGLCGHTIRAAKVKSTGIKKVSDKRKTEKEIYDERNPIFLQENPRCAVYPELKSEEVHHMKGRVGKLYLDERFWLAVSSKAHKKITNNPKWAIENGYSHLRLEKEK